MIFKKQFETLEQVCHAALRHLNIKFTYCYIDTFLQEHPHTPSLLTVKDLFESYGVCVDAYTNARFADIANLQGLPLLHMDVEEHFLRMVIAANDKEVKYIIPGAGIHTKTEADIANAFTGNIILLNKTANSSEPNYRRNRVTDVINWLKERSLLIMLAALAFIFVGQLFINAFAQPYIAGLLFAFCVLGLVFSAAIIKKQSGSKSAFTQKLCNIVSQSGCDAVIGSQYAKWLGLISLGDAAILYFSGCLLSLTLLPASMPVIAAVTACGCIATAYSLWLQWVIIKKTCGLCMALNTVIVAAAAIGIYYLIQYPPLITGSLFIAFCMVAFIFLLLAFGWIFLHISQSQRTNLAKYLFKYNQLMAVHNVQQQLLAAPAAKYYPDCFCFLQGQADAVITIVTNPACSICKNLHKEIEKMRQQISRKNISVHLVFACGNNEDSPLVNLFSAVLSLEADGNIAAANELLNTIYVTPKENYNVLADSYKPKITVAGRNRFKSHWEFCLNNNIELTPGIYFNGAAVPPALDIKDLYYLV